MGTVLLFNAPARAPSPDDEKRSDCEVVIFPGVRIEREEQSSLDLSHRLCDPAGRNNFGGHRPRKTS